MRTFKYFFVIKLILFCIKGCSQENVNCSLPSDYLSAFAVDVHGDIWIGAIEKVYGNSFIAMR